MSKRNFSSFIQTFLDYSKNVGAPEKFLLWSAISGVAAALERKTWVHYNGIQVIYPNLYIMLIADSGIAKKSTSTRPIMEIINGVKGISKMSTQMSGASLIEQLSDAGDSKVFDFGGVKYRNSSLFAFSSEAKVTIGGKSGLEGVQELLTDLYDCGRTNIWSEQNAWDKQTLSGGKIEIFNPCLNFLACSTPSWLNDSIGRSGIEGGFASRVLFINQKERVDDSGWLDEHELSSKPDEVKKLLIEDLSHINKIQGCYKTRIGWKETYNSIKADTNEKMDLGGEMKAYYSRKMWHLLKISQVLAADQSDELVLSPDHLISANELLKTIEDEMYSAFANQGENKQLASFTIVWNFIRKRSKWDRRSILAACYKHATTPQLDEHLRTLQSMGKIKLNMGPNGIVCDVIDSTPLGRYSEEAKC